MRQAAFIKALNAQRKSMNRGLEVGVGGEINYDIKVQS